ncbi:MAG: alkaline phosphatase family protein [Gemmataceae bacterium]
MRHQNCCWLACGFLGFGVILSVVAFPTVQGARSAPSQEKRTPKLVVLAVFDQMRGDFLTKWKKYFRKEGFGRLQSEGAWFTDCHYPYANTVTGAGHAGLVTGCSPNKNGIVGNSWYDRESAKTVNCIENVRYKSVPYLGEKARRGAPTRRRRPSVGDALMEQTNGKAKVVSISIKDRAAMLLAALRSLLCLWFNYEEGMFVTSTYYSTELPDWVMEYNKSRAVDKYFDQTWRQGRIDLDYFKIVGQDDFPYEGTGENQGQTMPHSMKAGLKKPGPPYYRALANSPFGNDVLADLAKRAIVEHKLGQDSYPDLLTIGFSSNDLVGHCWGPDSHEVFDITMRSDILIQDMLQFLDKKVGRGNYLFIVSADHGVCPIPEYRKLKEKKDAGHVEPRALLAKSLAFLDDKFGNGKKQRWIESGSSGMYYLNQGTLKELNLKSATVEQALADWLAKQPGMLTAFTRTELMANNPKRKNDPFFQQVKLSFHPENSGDVMPVIKPYYLPTPPINPKKPGAYTTTHGSPHPYDTHVPLLVFGPGVRPGIRNQRVSPLSVAAIISESLGIRPPSGAEAKVPKGLWR